MVWLVLALIAAFVEAIAVQKNNIRLEFIAKPTVMVSLLIWLYTGTGLQGSTFWFGLGLVFSLAGDLVLLSPSSSMFTIGLAAFLLTHILYIIGFGEQLLNLTAWSFILLFFIYVNSFRLLRRIVGAMRLQGQGSLSIPVIVYGLVISLMLYAAMATMYDPVWKTSATGLVSAGAFLFYISDLALAWNKFVSPVRYGRILNIVTYYLGQIGLMAGVIGQFGK